MTGNLSVEDQSNPARSISSWWRGKVSGNSEDAVSFPSMRPNLGRSLSSNLVRSGSTSGKYSRRIKKEYGIKVPIEFEDSPIFGVPYDISLDYASVNIKLNDRDGKEFVYGKVPIVVARCAAFLKEEGTKQEGIFRIAGSAKRVRALQELFSSPPNFGKDLKWDGFTVNDAANLVKRYFLQLPEPVIPAYLYQKFRDPLKNEFKATGDYMSYFAVRSISGSKDKEQKDKNKEENSDTPPNEPETPPVPPTNEEKELALNHYESLINQLPPTSRVILVYILDLLSVFAAEHATNRMSSYNLAAIFQPSILSIKEHDMNPEEYQTSSLVIEYLVDNSKTFLQRVQDNAVDEQDGKVEPFESKLDNRPPSPSASHQKHRRQHSKSLSSVFVPRIHVSETHTNGDAHSDHNSSSDEKSVKLKRSLKNLIPGNSDTNAETAKSSDKPTMSRSSSWKRVFSSDKDKE